MEDWLDSCINEALAACIIALDQVVCTPALDWFCQDCVGVGVAEHEDVAVAFVASPWKHAWEISADESFEFLEFKCVGGDLMASVNAGSGRVQWLFLSEDGVWLCPCGSGSLSGSLDSAHDGWNGLFKVFANSRGG